jgi:hypothetical protein
MPSNEPQPHPINKEVRCEPGDGREAKPPPIGEHAEEVNHKLTQPHEQQQLPEWQPN